MDNNELYCAAVDRLEELKKFANGFTGTLPRAIYSPDIRRLAICLFNVSAYAMAIASPDNPPAEARVMLEMTKEHV